MREVQMENIKSQLRKWYNINLRNMGMESIKQRRVYAAKDNIHAREVKIIIPATRKISLYVCFPI